MKNLAVLSLIFLISFCSFSCSDLITERDDLSAKPDPQNVQILYKYSFRNELNTFTQKFTKDLVLDGTVTIDFWLTEAEQNMILEAATQTDYFSMPDSLVWTGIDSLKAHIEPDPGIQYLKIRTGSKDKIVYWYLVNSYPKEYAQLVKLTSLIKEIIESKKEYKDLPAARGGYI